MSIEAKTTRFSFLTSGPTYSVVLPTEFQTPFLMSSPIVSGTGARSFDFTPAPLDSGLADGMARDGSLLEVLTDSQGRSVELYARVEPVAWWLRWPLKNGSLATHLREEDGVDRASVVVWSLSIDETGPNPFLLMDVPLRSAVSADSRYQETAATFSTNEDGISVTFMRPGFLEPGAVMATDGNGSSSLREGTQFGMEIQVKGSWSRASSQEILALVAESLTEG